MSSIRNCILYPRLKKFHLNMEMDEESLNNFINDTIGNFSDEDGVDDVIANGGDYSAGDHVDQSHSDDTFSDSDTEPNSASCTVCRNMHSDVNSKGVFYKTCSKCRSRQKCIHNRNKYTCKLCKGPGVCEHGVTKYTCKKCGGISICEHHVQRYFCKICKGGGICEHGNQRRICANCGFVLINPCPHGRDQYRCVDCKGKGICKHKLQKGQCRKCRLDVFKKVDGGEIIEKNKNSDVRLDRQSSISKQNVNVCKHGYWKSLCKECGKGICRHNCERDKCYGCKKLSGDLCKHELLRINCRKCLNTTPRK